MGLLTPTAIGAGTAVLSKKKKPPVATNPIATISPPKNPLSGGTQATVKAAQPAPAPTAPTGGADQPVFQPDSGYTAQMGQANFDANQKMSQLQTQEENQSTDLMTSLARLRAQQPKDEQATQEGAANQGLFYSGILGQRLGDLDTQYSQKISDAQLAGDRSTAAIEAAKSAIQQGLPLTEAAARAAAVDRQITRDQAAAGADALVPDQPAAAATAATAGYHSGHSAGHEYYVPGLGWVSKTRYQLATGGK